MKITFSNELKMNNDNKYYLKFCKQLEKKLSSEINGGLARMFYSDIYIELYVIFGVNFSHRINELILTLYE